MGKQVLDPHSFKVLLVKLVNITDDDVAALFCKAMDELLAQAEIPKIPRGVRVGSRCSLDDGQRIGDAFQFIQHVYVEILSAGPYLADVGKAIAEKTVEGALAAYLAAQIGKLVSDAWRRVKGVKAKSIEALLVSEAKKKPRKRQRPKRAVCKKRGC